jgi:hypothetical protein
VGTEHSSLPRRRFGGVLSLLSCDVLAPSCERLSAYCVGPGLVLSCPFCFICCSVLATVVPLQVGRLIGAALISRSRRCRLSCARRLVQYSSYLYCLPSRRGTLHPQTWSCLVPLGVWRVQQSSFVGHVHQVQSPASRNICAPADAGARRTPAFVRRLSSVNRSITAQAHPCDARSVPTYQS